MQEKKSKVEPSGLGLFNNSFTNIQTPLLNPNKKCSDSLLLAIHSGSLEKVKYMESILHPTELKEQWTKIDALTAIEYIVRMITEDLPIHPTYKDLGNWYCANEAMPWKERYDNECLVHESLSHWNDCQWKNRVRLYPEVLLYRWFTPGIDCVITPQICLENKPIGTLEKRLMAPSREVHDKVVKLIREELLELKTYVETYAEGLDCGSTELSFEGGFLY